MSADYKSARLDLIRDKALYVVSHGWRQKLVRFIAGERRYMGVVTLAILACDEVRPCTTAGVQTAIMRARYDARKAFPVAWRLMPWLRSLIPNTVNWWRDSTP